jgi:hypothetical protein
MEENMKIQNHDNVVDSRELLTRTLSEISTSKYWDMSTDETKLKRIREAFDTLEKWVLGVDMNNLSENQLTDLGFKPYEYSNLVTIWLVPLYFTWAVKYRTGTKCITKDGDHFQIGDRAIYPEESPDGYHYPFGVLARGSDEKKTWGDIQCPGCGREFISDLD